EQRLKNPDSAFHRGGTRRRRGQRQDARLSKQSATMLPGFELNQPEFLSADAFDPIVTGKPFVQKGVIRIKKIHDAAVISDDVLDKSPGLLTHCLPKRFVEIGKQLC